VKEFLRVRGVTLEDVDVTRDIEAREELVRLTGQAAVPVITIEDEVVRGFDEARLKTLLGI
jgi:glutaredoxin